MRRSSKESVSRWDGQVTPGRNAKGRALGPAFDEIDLLNGAGDEIRTHDPNLGKVVLYP